MRAALLVVLLAAPASGACQGDEMFSCQIGRKTLDVCYWKGLLTYRFGREGKPELTVSEPLETVAYTPWPGFSRSIWSSVVFTNKGVGYEVWASFDRMEENATLEGGVIVQEGSTTIAELTCDRGSVSGLLDGISDLKSGIGQCWDMETQAWGKCN